MARDGLLAKLRSAMQSAIAGNQRKSIFARKVRQAANLHPVFLATLSPLPSSQQTPGLFLVTFVPELSEKLLVIAAAGDGRRTRDFIRSRKRAEVDPCGVARNDRAVGERERGAESRQRGSHLNERGASVD